MVLFFCLLTFSLPSGLRHGDDGTLPSIREEVSYHLKDASRSKATHECEKGQLYVSYFVGQEEGPAENYAST